jgi:hypothetical protein
VTSNKINGTINDTDASHQASRSSIASNVTSSSKSSGLSRVTKVGVGVGAGVGGIIALGLGAFMLHRRRQQRQGQRQPDEIFEAPGNPARPKDVVVEMPDNQVLEMAQPMSEMPEETVVSKMPLNLVSRSLPSPKLP